LSLGVKLRGFGRIDIVKVNPEGLRKVDVDSTNLPLEVGFLFYEIAMMETGGLQLQILNSQFLWVEVSVQS